MGIVVPAGAVALGGPLADPAPAPLRAALWQRLAQLVSFPTAALRREIADGTLAAEVHDLAGALPYRLDVSRVALRGEAAAAAAEAEAEYIRLFDVPVDGPTVPLYGGVHSGRDRRQVMEELLRHYRHFGLPTAAAPARDVPDAVATVLEFLHILASIEPHGAGVDAARAAQRDVLARHITRWTPGILDGLRRPLPLYRASLDLVHRFALAELARLGGEGARPEPVSVRLAVRAV